MLQDQSKVRIATRIRLGDKISSGEVPAIEIKRLGSHGLLYCSPSVHKDGFPYEIIGTRKPVILNERQTHELEIHLDKILTKYGIVYQSASTKHKALTSIKELFKPGHNVLKGHNRHEDLLRVMDSLIRRNKDIMTLERRIICGPIAFACDNTLCNGRKQYDDRKRVNYYYFHFL
jgi:hypothetical protein